MRLLAVILAIAAFTAPVAFAQQQGAQQHDHDKPACTAMDAALPAGIEDWNGKTAIATSADVASAATLQLGKGYEAALKKKGDVAFAVEPEKPGGSVSYSGVFVFDVIEPGNYAVAMSTAAWIDVVEDGKALEPLSFGHGPQCTTIRKKVVYPMKAGRHILQIAGNGAETARVLVAKQP